MKKFRPGFGFQNFRTGAESESENVTPATSDLSDGKNHLTYAGSGFHIAKQALRCIAVFCANMFKEFMQDGF